MGGYSAADPGTVGRGQSLRFADTSSCQAPWIERTTIMPRTWQEYTSYFVQCIIYKTRLIWGFAVLLATCCAYATETYTNLSCVGLVQDSCQLKRTIARRKPTRANTLSTKCRVICTHKTPSPHYSPPPPPPPPPPLPLLSAASPRGRSSCWPWAFWRVWSPG